MSIDLESSWNNGDGMGILLDILVASYYFDDGVALTSFTKEILVSHIIM